MIRNLEKGGLSKERKIGFTCSEHEVVRKTSPLTQEYFSVIRQLLGYMSTAWPIIVCLKRIRKHKNVHFHDFLSVSCNVKRPLMTLKPQFYIKFNVEAHLHCHKFKFIVVDLIFMKNIKLWILG